MPKVSNYAKGERSRIFCFQIVRREALEIGDLLMYELLPEGSHVGHEWIAKNPIRYDKRPGSFKINLKSGKWADFATDARGGDLISLVAYLLDMRQLEAAEWILDFKDNFTYA